MSMRVLYILFALLACACAQAAPPGTDAYRFHARGWSVEDGLPQVTVTALAQDRQGFIWAGTQDGLARFDGSHFALFDGGNTPALHGNGVKALALDHDGRLWIATDGGLGLHGDDGFRQLPPQPDMGAIRALVASDRGVWIAAQRGLFLVGRGQLTARAVPGWPTSPARAIALDAQGRPWVAAKSGVYGPGRAPDTFRHVPLPDESLSADAIAWFDGRLWVGTNHGLYRLEGSRLAAVLPRLSKRSIAALLPGPSQRLWIGTDAGLFRLDNQGGLLDFARTARLKDQWIWSLASDRAGDLWIGTGAHGLIRLWHNHIAWFDSAAGLDGQLMTSVYREPDGTLLVGSRTGVYRFEDGSFHLLHGDGNLPSAVVHGLLRQPDGRLWVATVGGLAIMQGEHAIKLPPALAPLAHANVYSLRADPDGTTWIGTTHGLFRYRDGRLQGYGHEAGLDQKFIRGTFRTRDGTLWVATNDGAFVMADGRFQPVCAGPDQTGPVVDIKESTDGTAWIVVATGVLIEYRNDHCTRYAWDQRPLSGSLYSATPDGHGNLWLTNARGVFRIPIARLRHAAATGTTAVPDRMIQSEGGHHQIHPVGGAPQTSLLVDGHLWIPTVDGVLMIDIQQPPRAATSAPVVIESISRGSQTIELTAKTSRITLPPGETDLRITYAQLDYRDPGSARFLYRLSGYDREWIDAGTRRQALYTHLPPGSYRFEVRTAAAHGSRAAPGDALDLTVEPFFYQTWWFRLLVGLAVLGGAYAGYALRTRQLRGRQVELERLVAARTDALREANEKLQRMSVTDPLTGLKNRRYFTQAIERDAARLQREAGPPATDRAEILLMLDVDDFKLVNDTHGHLVGDAVLTQLGDLLKQQLRDSDSVIRWGGEEFLVVARNTDPARASVLAEKLRAAVANHRFDVGAGGTVACTCSIGYCVFPFAARAPGQPGWERSVNLADAALYRAKRMGKNAWVGVKPTPAAQGADPEALHADLGGLLEAGLATVEAGPGKVG